MFRFLTFLSLIVLATQGKAQDVRPCAGIKSAIERLECYDRLAERQEHEVVDKDARKAREVIKQDSPTYESESETQKAVKQVVSESASSYEPEAKDSRWDIFGLRPKKDKNKEVTRISDFIADVEYLANGKKVFTLSNGQVWVEREPNPRKIAANQPATIIKKRWHYELDPDRGPRVTVERLDPDVEIKRVDGRANM